MFALGVLLGTASCAQVLGLDEFEDCAADSCSGALWAKSFGSHEFVFPESARFDSKGNILLSGFFRGTTDFGGSPLISSHNAFFLAKLKPDGSHAVSRPLLVEGLDGAMGSRLSVLPDDSVVLSGCYEESIDFGSGDPITVPGPDEDADFVARFSSDSELIWARNLFTGTGRLRVLDSAATLDGDVVLVGSFDREVSLGTSTLTTASEDAFIARLDGETGQELWSLQLGDPEDTSAETTIEATAVAVGPDGNIIVGGRFTGFTEFGFDDRSGPSPSGAGAFLLNLVGTGRRDWTALIQGEGDARVSDIDIDARGNVIAAGAFAGAISILTRGVLGAHQTSGPADSDVLLVKLSSAGNHLWSLSFGDDSAQLDGWSSGSNRIVPGPSIAVDVAGDIVLGTGVAGDVDLGGGLLGGRQDHDWALAKLSAGGEHLWSDRFGDPAAAQGVIAIDTDPSTNAIAVTGANDGVLDFGNGMTVGEAGKLSAVVVKIDPERVGR
ncbi:hypothetical protein WME76_33655 [Sorangium sp. So ce119]|uniref:hypothetical protein n=1 Tax=Sorangium sp. So ce119 TaxID=3133279 RepID=UPI003F61BE2D